MYVNITRLGYFCIYIYIHFFFLLRSSNIIPLRVFYIRLLKENYNFIILNIIVPSPSYVTYINVRIKTFKWCNKKNIYFAKLKEVFFAFLQNTLQKLLNKPLYKVII